MNLWKVTMQEEREQNHMDLDGPRRFLGLVSLNVVAADGLAAFNAAARIRMGVERYDATGRGDYYWPKGHQLWGLELLAPVHAEASSV